MKPALLPLLRCPLTRSPLTIQSIEARTPPDDIQAGTLAAEGGRTYRIFDGIPHLYSGYRSSDEASTVEAFGDQWARYDNFDGYMGSPELFADFSGLRPEQVAGKRVLEVGCGGGRWLSVLASWGASEVVGLDFSAAVHQAARRTAHLANVHVVRGSALEMPLGSCFDLVVSIGVIHHLDDPVLGLRGIRRAVAPSHLIAIWVYGREGNELYLRVAGPVRRLTPRLPRAVLVGVSRVLSAGVWAYAHATRPLAALPIPLKQYSALLRELRLRDIEAVVHDQLTPSLARYPTREEVCTWVEEAGGEIRQMHHRRGNSWQCHFAFRDPS